LERRLAAILIADVVGYTRLMSEDETGTLAALNALRECLFQPMVAGANGTFIKRMGDGWIVEFANVSEAVTCAIEIQKRLRDHEIVKLRIGVHIGDVTFQEDDIYGDGLNIAARLEALAQPGQVLISDTVHHSLDSKAIEQFAGGETVELKNVTRPVGVWRWPAASDADAILPLTVSSKPSIAVLPFENMSGDPEQEYFSDGMTEDIITALSKFHWFLVIARNSSFVYKGQAVDIKKIGLELGVNYVLEGSIRKAGGRIRINAQLIECVSGNHLWAERYDGTLDDIFDLQDQITESIVTEIEPELGRQERDTVKRKPTSNLTAWDLLMRGIDHFNKADADNVQTARSFFDKAVDQDPDYAQARAWRAASMAAFLFTGGPTALEPDTPNMLAEARRAVALDPTDAFVHLSLGRCLQVAGDPDGSVLELRKAIKLNPNMGQSHFALALTLQLAFYHLEEAQQHFDRALRLSPKDPLSWSLWMLKGSGLRMLGQYQEAVECCQQAVHVPDCSFLAFMHLAAAQAAFGNTSAAARALDQAKMMKPDLSVATVSEVFKVAQAHPEISKSILVDLRKAGLPEE